MSSQRELLFVFVHPILANWRAIILRIYLFDAATIVVITAKYKIAKAEK